MKKVSEVLGDDWYGSAILDEIRRLRKTVQPIAAKHVFPSEPVVCANTLHPFVLVLGNHSSGKSSFINFLLGQKVQETGVAPTDDGFTILGHAHEDLDRNGPALVGDPDLGFQGLSAFGSTLVSHTQLKLRRDVAVRDFFIVDSPGMIDSPTQLQEKNKNNSNNSNNNDTHDQEAAAKKLERGYDFEGVVRWYAERADVILFTFDPEKPGTTGETLSILTSSLAGMDHKLFIILNKADQFKKIHDFARAYGSLCWNLSKVIPRKDLPRIYTMCLPAFAVEQSTNSASSEMALSLPGSAQRSFFAHGLADLEESRSEVLREVFNAPKRRVDNEISRLTDTLHTLSVHCKVVDRIASLHSRRLWSARLSTVLCVAVSVGLTYGVNRLCDLLSVDTISSAPLTAEGSSTPVATEAVNAIAAEVALPATSVFDTLSQWIRGNMRQSLLLATSSLSALSSSLVIALQYRDLHRYAESFANKSTVQKIVRQVLAEDEPLMRSEYAQSLGEQIANSLPSRLSPEVVSSLSGVSKQDFASLHRILHEDIANLRRRAVPTSSSPSSSLSSSVTTSTSTATTVTTEITQSDTIPSHSSLTDISAVPPQKERVTIPSVGEEVA